MKPALLPLTSFRFFAALAVVMFHRPRAGADDWLPYERFIGAVMPFFFLLSGFTLTYAYHDRFRSRRPGAAREFLAARAARIMPAYLLAFVLTLLVWPGGVLSALGSAAVWARGLAHVTLTQALVPYADWYFAFNPPAWSLSCDGFFYLAFPLLLLGLATGSVRRRVAVFVATSAVWVAVLGVYLSAPVDPARDLFKWAWLGYVFPPTRIFDFLCGVVLGVLFVRAGPKIGPAHGWRYWAWGGVELGALGVLWATFHFCPFSLGVGGPQTFALQMLSWQGYHLPAWAFLVWVGALGRGPLSRALSVGPLVYLGELSYGIYIYHSVVLWLIVSRVPLAGWDPVLWSRTVTGASAVGVLALAALSYHFWEMPIRNRVRRRTRRPADETPVDEPPAVILKFPQPARRAA